MSAPLYAHQKNMQDQNLDLKSETLSPSTRRAIERFDTALAAANDMKDTTQKNIATEKLKIQSDKIVGMLNDDVKDHAEKTAAADKKKEEDDKKKSDGADTKKKDDEAAAAKKKEEDEAAAKKKAAAAADTKKDNPYDLSESKLEAYKVMEKLFTEKAKNGEMVISEQDMSAAGFNPWAHLGMTTGKVGNFLFSASVFSDNWTVTKEKKEQPAKV